MDGNKENNNISNLEWCTAQQNNEHALKTHLRKGFIPISIKKELVQEFLKGKTVKELSKNFPNTHPNTLSRMMREQAKKDNLEKEWKQEAKNKRRIVACKNLKKINVKN